MQFKHPELLYALFLLLIPIFIHLFQLRRFKRVDFTNVAFLKKVTIQTRKSSQLKKWITLLLRLLGLACIIIAFAQPFTATKTALNTNKETVIYIDNSFSLQAKGANGPLLTRSLQDLYDLQTDTEKLNWFTNDFTRKNVSAQDFKSNILSVSYSQDQLSLSEILLKANQLFSNSEASEKRLILISDFQQEDTFPEIPENITVNVVQLKPVNTNNIAVDSVYISSKSGKNIQLKVDVSATGAVPERVPVSLFNNSGLIAKTAVNFSSNKSNTTVFDIENVTDFNGKLEITDPNLPYDNQLYFSINSPKKIKVLAINEANSTYLQRLFNQDEFAYTQQTQTNLNYNEIPNQDFIIINEFTAVPASLINALKSFTENGGSLLVIPSSNAKLEDYNALLSSLGMGRFSEKISAEKQVTQIIFDNPLYKNVFEKQVVNFQYPTVNSYYSTNTNATAVLKFEDGSPFIFQKNNCYFLSAPINSENSNFQNSPLIVPTFYNMAQQSLALPNLYYTIGKQNNFDVPVQLMEDQILEIKDSTTAFIPLQQTKANKVTVTTTEEPATAGTYSILNKNDFISNISYNYNRKESELQYLNTENWKGVTTSDSIAELLDSISESNNINSFWKWFLIFALLFLIMEMLVLKFFK